MTFGPEARARLELLNADHRRRIDEGLSRYESAGTLGQLIAEDERSREQLCSAMLGCAERWRMRSSEKLRVLELGAGLGGDIGYLEKRLSAEYSGVEVVPALAARLRSSGVECAAVEDLPAEWSERFHFIYSRHVMEHVVDLDRALSELRRVLAPNGILGAVTPHGFPDPEPAHVTQQTLDEWMRHYHRHGLVSAFAAALTFNGPEAHIVCVRSDWPNGPR